MSRCEARRKYHLTVSADADAEISLITTRWVGIGKENRVSV